MKRFYLFFVVLFNICISCSNLSKNSQLDGKPETNIDSIILVQKNETKNNMIDGVWAENETENALFFIKSGNLYYTEDQGNAIPIELKGGTLIIKNELTVYCKILKLNNDSLWFTDQFSNDTTKLFKR